MATTLCVSGAVLAKAGVGVNSQVSGGILQGGTDYAVDEWINQAESVINAVCRKDYVAAYSGLTAAKKKILEQVASDLAAIYCVSYDMSGYTSRIEAEDIINVLRDRVLFGLGLLRDKEIQRFIG